MEKKRRLDRLKPWFKAVVLDILKFRQDAHIVAYKCHLDQEKWKAINEADIAEAKRKGKIKDLPGESALIDRKLLL